jgi:cytoskeleton protein RodZ
MKLSEYHEIGQYLCESRESLRVSLEDAARALHIRVKYLEALESGDLKDFPGKAYARGYIRNYAHYLRLDPDEVLSAYDSLLGPKTQMLFIPEPTLRQNLPTRSALWLSLAGLAALYAYWYYNFYDQGDTAAPVAEVPRKLEHLLDKGPPPAMDKAWANCLDSGNTGCYFLLRLKAHERYDKKFYDISGIAQEEP